MLSAQALMSASLSMLLAPAQEAWPFLLGLKFSDVVGCITDTVPVTPGDHHHHVLDQDLNLHFGVLVVFHLKSPELRLQYG